MNTRKKRNPQDLTLRNLRALKRQIRAALKQPLEALARRVRRLELRVVRRGR